MKGKENEMAYEPTEEDIEITLEGYTDFDWADYDWRQITKDMAADEVIQSNDYDTAAFQDRRNLIIEQNRIEDGFWDGCYCRVVSNDGDGRLPISEAWDEAIEIEGKGDDDYQSIGDDQLVDEKGDATYPHGYRLWIGDEGDSGQAYCDYTAEEMEAFARTMEAVK